MLPVSPERGPSLTQTPNRASLVLQPGKTESLRMLVEEINEIPSESLSDSGAGDWSDGGQAATKQTSTQGASARDRALANLPAAAKMQKKLEAHIRSEVKKLRKQTRIIIRSRTPGSAYALAQLFAKIRHLNALLADLLEISYDVLKRLFVKVFIDRQAIG